MNESVTVTSQRACELIWEALTTVDPDTLSDNLALRGIDATNGRELDSVAALFPHADRLPAADLAEQAEQAIVAVIAQLEGLTDEQARAVLRECIAITEAQS